MAIRSMLLRATILLAPLWLTWSHARETPCILGERMRNDTIDAGDFYHDGKRKVTLLRVAGMFSLEFEDASQGKRLAESLAGKQGLLAGYQIIRCSEGPFAFAQSSVEELRRQVNDPSRYASLLAALRGVPSREPMKLGLALPWRERAISLAERRRLPI